MLFYLFLPGGFSYLINQKNYNSNWKKILGFRKMQEKLEKMFFGGQNLFFMFLDDFLNLSVQTFDENQLSNI